MRIDVQPADFARTRFAVSRLAELGNALEVVARPDLAPYAHRWVGQVRRRLDPARAAVVSALTGQVSWYVPDFLVPVPDCYEPELAGQLAAVAATPPQVVRRQVELAFRVGPVPPEARDHAGAAAGEDPRPPLPAAVAEVLAGGGEAGLAARAAEELEYCWSVVLADSWPALRAVLDADVAHHAATAGRRGLLELLGDLHSWLDWDGSSLAVRSRWSVRVRATDGLVLVPSVFLPRPAVWLHRTGPSMVGYPARGRGRVWSSPEPAGHESDVLGPRRAALLADLDFPRSTTQLAARHGVDAATVSYHLHRLHRAGLVTRRRDGRSVLYERTPRAAAVLAVLEAGG